jgi:hypothetical protein
VWTPNPEITAVYPFAEVWRRAHHYIIAHNKRWSVTFNGPLFDQTKLAHDQTPGISIEPRGALTMSMIKPTSPNFAPVKVATREATNAAYIRIGNGMEAQSPATTAISWRGGDESQQTTPTNQGGHGLLHADNNLERLVKALASSSCSPEVLERIKTQEKVVLRYMLTFATVTKSAEGETVLPAKLKPGFIEMIKGTNLNSAKSLWNDMLNQDARLRGIAQNAGTAESPSRRAT